MYHFFYFKIQKLSGDGACSLPQTSPPLCPNNSPPLANTSGSASGPRDQTETKTVSLKTNTKTVKILPQGFPSLL